MTEMTRRSFATMMAAGPAAAAEKPIPTRRLGKINFQAGILGIGAQYLGDLELEQSHVNRVVAEAIDNGINYFDTAPPYNISEERLGHALKGKRDKVFLVSKVETNAKGDALYQIRDSLRKLQTDHLDCCHIHNISREDRYPKLDLVLAMDGTLGALLEAKKQGMIKHIGVTSHLRPARVLPALETGEVELLMCSINHVERHIYGYEEKVLPECRKRNIGVIAMKVLGGPVRNSLARLITPQEYADTLRYTWGVQGVCVAIIGIRMQDQLHQALAAARAFKPLTPEEMTGVTERGKQLAAKWGPLRGPVA
jgi:aryl-alcohol dehydrogenase-like predicted oxidoreductase